MKINVDILHDGKQNIAITFISLSFVFVYTNM